MKIPTIISFFLLTKIPGKAPAIAALVPMIWQEKTALLLLLPITRGELNKMTCDLVAMACLVVILYRSTRYAILKPETKDNYESTDSLEAK